VLKVTKNNLTFIVPNYWIDSRGFLKVPAVCALKLFFGEISLEDALEGAKKKWRYRWTISKVNREKEVNGE
jgi:hypothetical protein